jgi:protein phosphatase
VPSLHIAGASDLGRARRDNQDRWLVDAAQGVCLVADGMGGAPAGAVAAQLVLDHLPAALRQHQAELADLAAPAALRGATEALGRVNDEAHWYAEEHPEVRGMGSTVVLALVRGRWALIAHVGDSRAYRWRAGAIERLTADHADDQGRLTQCVGTYGPIQAAARAVALEPGDRLLLCTDGLTNLLDDAAIGALLGGRGAPAAICRALIDAANASGGLDNITVIVAQVC